MRKIRIEKYILIFVTVNLSIYGSESASTGAHPNGWIPEDAFLNFTELAMKYKAGPCEEYDVTTADGYVLALFRLRGGGRPALLLHGILGSADDFLLRGASSLAPALAARGHDVWVGNVRGGRYSRRHARLVPDRDAAFWDFGLHDHACSDLPAMIDFVLEKTGHAALRLVGYSQGTTVSFILMSAEPEYNRKISVFVAVAPVVFLSDLPSPLPLILPARDSVDVLLRSLRVNEILGFYSLSKAFLEQLCRHGSIGYRLCLNLIFPVIGYDPPEYDPEFISVLFGHFPTGTSRKNLMDFARLATTDVFGRTDRRPAMNRVAYSSTSVQYYDLNNVKAETHLITAKNDKLSRLNDVALLKQKLTNTVHDHLMESPAFCHFDYIWGRVGHKVVAQKILQIFDGQA